MWQGAALMPDNVDATAYALCEAGIWLKNRDPNAADRFYKALVIRCGKTALGKKADERRWFPELPQEHLPPPEGDPSRPAGTVPPRPPVEER